MKRRVALVVATCMLAGAMTVPVSADELKGSGEKLIVGTMANALAFRYIGLGKGIFLRMQA